jgi:hypothetical protein
MIYDWEEKEKNNLLVEISKAFDVGGLSRYMIQTHTFFCHFFASIFYTILLFYHLNKSSNDFSPINKIEIF